MRVCTPLQSSTPVSGGWPPPPGKKADRSSTMPSGPAASTVASHSRNVASSSSSRTVPTSSTLWRRLSPMPLVVLRGGTRDGESTVVDDHVTRLYAASHAPGLVDIYEATDESQHIPGNDEDAIV